MKSPQVDSILKRKKKCCPLKNSADSTAHGTEAGLQMINFELIGRLCNDAEFEKGIELYNKGRITRFDIYALDETTDEMEASIREKGGRSEYFAQIVYDTVQDKVKNSSCECPEFYSYPGICRHCVAALLAYQDYMMEEYDPEFMDGFEEETDEDYSMRQMDLSDFLEGYEVTGKQESLPAFFPETTPEIKKLLMLQMQKKVLPVTDENLYGKVRLLPFLECNERGILLEFRIGAESTYVLKDVFEFVKNVESGKDYRYGKKLRFVHIREAFDDYSRRLYEFIRGWTLLHEAEYYQHGYYDFYSGYGLTLQKVRRMRLSVGEMEEFLLLTGTQGFTANIDGSGEKTWRVSENPLPRTLTLTGEARGIRLKLGYLSGYQGKNYYIYFVDQLVYLEAVNKLEAIRDFVACMAQVPNREVYVAKEDVPAFCRELLPVLKEHYQCEIENFQEEEYILPLTIKIYLDAPQKDFITCSMTAVYGERQYPLFGEQEAQWPGGERDGAAEMQAQKIVSSYFNAYDSRRKQMVLTQDEEGIYRLLTEGLSVFGGLGEVFISDALKKIRILPAPQVTVGVTLSGDLLELTLNTPDLSMQQLAEILSRYDKKKKFYRLKSGDIVNLSEEAFGRLAEMTSDLDLSERQLKQDVIALPKYRALYLEECLSEEETENEAFRKLLSNIKDTDTKNYEVPISLEETLRDYQKQGYAWMKMLLHNGLGGILADDMGLGKTLQIIALLLSEFLEAGQEDNRRCLIVSPASLVYNWYSELKRFAPVLPVIMVTGKAKERETLICRSNKRSILLTSYDLLKRDIDYYENIAFYCEVIDEAQYIKNAGTQAAHAVKRVQAGVKLALTGTPVENRLSELWSIFDYLMPGFLYSYKRFTEEFEIPIVQGQNGERMTRLKRMIAPFVLRRLKKDVLQDLPDKLEENVVAQMTDGQRELYDAHVKRLQLFLDKQTDEEFKKGKIQILAELTRLRQLCCDPLLVYENYAGGSAKLELGIDLIHNAIESGHKILLFSQFTTMLERIADRLKKEKISYMMLTGSTKKEERMRMVETFNRDGTNVFCISLKAGGTGLNLTAADIVIHYDPWWNLAVQNQATDRAHRIGQENVVTVYKLLAKDSIEENIVKLQEKKKELAEQILSGGEISEISFDREEILSLLGKD